jgi:hypothetical protein
VLGQAHQRGLHHLLGLEGSVQRGRVEAAYAIPQRDVWRGGGLRLERTDRPHRLHHTKPAAPEQELAVERGAIQLSRAQLHGAGR